ncbi:hypothetical protein [Umboniibacter marinipuniceus]|uniref:Uncharacterized protein n=1 Tax=Umboniibacter marinipuniceus TaxID=569599 RepID=A0A3M0AER9_9GAMM|nr:hypothetical protein [Umboniibacter marinipuniceus]RMA80945.1 hypothetical protein DFR27_0734 [Umboniibacter marinipuniceus]
MSVVARVKKSVWNLGAVCFFIWFGFKAIGYGMDLFDIEGPSLCSYTDVAEFTSPNGKKIAKLGYSDCGATTNWQTGINIVDVETGKVFNGFFGLNGKPDNLEVIWESDIKLTLTNFPIENLLWFNQDYFSGVSVEIKSSMANKSIKQD